MAYCMGCGKEISDLAPRCPRCGRTADPIRAQPTHQGPASTAHGVGYWVFIGWWWGPVKWAGRVALWLLLWPLGIWRSIMHARKTRELRERRGYRP